MTDLDILNEIKVICKNYPVMEERMEALKQAGYEDIKYHYVKHGKGLYGIQLLPKKHIYRIQIGYTELQKGYSAAWCIDISSIDVEYEEELPF